MTGMPKLLMVFEKPGEFGYLGEEYLRAFYDNGWHVTVCYLREELDEEYMRRLPVHQAVCFRLSKSQVRGLKIASIRKMRRLLSRHSFDLVLSHQYQANSCVGVAGFFRSDVIKYAVFHGIDPLSAFSRKFYYSTIGRRFDRFICVSDAQCRNVMKRCPARPPEKFSVIRNVINKENVLKKIKERAEARKDLGLDENDFVIGTISRLTADKRIADILYAYKQIEEKIPEARLLIIGTGHQRQMIADEAERLGLEKILTCTGYMEQAWKFLKAFDVFVLPSKFEACGLVLLEAMCAKVPIIASNTQGIAEALNNVGYLFEVGKHAELADRILQIRNLSDSEKQHMVEMGFERVKAEFDKEPFQKRLISLASGDLSNSL